MRRCSDAGSLATSSSSSAARRHANQQRHVRRQRCRCRCHHGAAEEFSPAPIDFDTIPAFVCAGPSPDRAGQQVTLTSQVSLDRWPRWVQQADSWGGPVSVAVFVPAPAGSPAADAALQLVQEEAAAFSGSRRDQPLVVSVLFARHHAQQGRDTLQARLGWPLPTPPAAPSYDQLYPINALRNLAVRAASTPLVLAADGDFLFSRGLQQQLHQPTTSSGPSLAQQLLQHTAAPGPQQQPQQPVMLVLPQFELALPTELPDSQPADVPRTKPDLARALSAGSVVPFHCGAFPPRRHPIELTAWLNRNMAVKAASYEEFWEPQGVAVRAQLPPWDECFRGYGLNKVQHAWHAAALGYRFLVLPDAFMVTAPHKRSSSWRPAPGTAADGEHLARIQLVYRGFKQRLAQQLAGPVM